MKSKTFIILLALCAVLGLFTYFVTGSGKQSAKTADTAADVFLAELPVNDITSISIRDKENTLELEKGESVWEVKSRFGYPADFAKITEFAKKLKDCKVGRSFEATEDMRLRLALCSPDEQNVKDLKDENKGTLVTLKNKENKVLADIIIGNAREVASGSGGHYMMNAGGNTVYLVDKDFKFMDKKPEDWIRTDLLDVKAEDVEEVVCKDRKNDTVLYTLKRPEKDKNPEFLHPPEGKKLMQSKINSVFSALGSFRIDDVADPALSAADTETENICLTYRMYDGTEYTACPGTASKEDTEKFYFRAAVSYTEPPKAADAEPDPETEAEKTADSGEKPAMVPDDKADKEDKPPVNADEKADTGDKAEEKKEEKPDPAKRKADAEELNRKISPWTYMIPKWKAERLISDPEEFFEKPEEEADNENEAPPMMLPQ